MDMWNSKVSLLAESGSKTCEEICETAEGMTRELAGIRSGFCKQFMSLGVAALCTASLKPELLGIGEPSCILQHLERPRLAPSTPFLLLACRDKWF